MTAIVDRARKWASCRTCMARASRYIDRELHDADRAWMDAHIALCGSCREQIDRMASASSLVAALQLPDPQSTRLPAWFLNDRPEPERRWGLAVPLAAFATVALVAATALLVWRLLPPTPTGWTATAVAGAPRLGDHQILAPAHVALGEWIETDAGSHATLDCSDVGRVEVDANSRVSLVDFAPDRSRFRLDRGRIVAHIQAPPRVVLIETPAATAIDLGCAYSLVVDDAGATELRVISGWVALEADGRTSYIPAGSVCRAIPGKGPGTPYLEDASDDVKRALFAFDFEEGRGGALDVVLNGARYRDGLTLWHLLLRTQGDDREHVFRMLATLVPPPVGVTGDGVRALDPAMLDAWRRKLEYVAVGVDPDGVPSVPGTVTSAGAMHVGRVGHTATRLADGRVLVTGGASGGGGADMKDVLADAELYDPATNGFVRTGNMLEARVGHSATLLDDGTVLIVGGSSGSAELYEPKRGAFVAVGRPGAYRANHQATLLKSGLVLVTGGEDGRGDTWASAELYDPRSRSFRPTGAMREARTRHSATLLDDGRVLIAGGGVGNYYSPVVLQTAEIYNPDTETFEPVGNLTVTRQKHGAVLLGDGRVLVIGGVYDELNGPAPSNAEVFDPATGRFTAIHDTHTTHFKVHNAVVLLPSGEVLIAGGGAMFEIFNPGTGLFSRVESSYDALRYYATATLLASGDVLIVGGTGRGVDARTDAYVFHPRP